jgi:deazaflavin-dependent oxidoreductase (nitroreductase family)
MWLNPIMAGLLRSPFHALLSHNTMLFTVRGRKTGRPVTTPVNYVQRGDELLTVSFRSRTWWRNLRGGRPVELVLSGQRREADASVAETLSEVERGLEEIVARSPSYARPLGVALNAAGQPRREDLASAAATRVVVRTQLRDGLKAIDGPRGRRSARIGLKRDPGG